VSSSELRVRIARPGDLQPILALLRTAGSAIEKIAAERTAIELIIDRNQRSLAGSATPAEETFLFLLERMSGEIVGCAVLQRQIGLDEPFYDYRVGQVVHSSRRLKSYRCLDVLYLCNDLTGSSEAHSLYVSPEARQEGGATMLVKALALFIARHPDRFAERLVIELPGAQDEFGASPFWEALGRHFFKVDQRAAERLVAHGRKSFIAELMPKHPVYVALLPESAQDSIAKVHRDALPLLSALEREGFHYESHIDIFDGGRVMEAHTQQLASVLGSLNATAHHPDDQPPELPSQACWLARGDLGEFTVTRCEGRLDTSAAATAPVFYCPTAAIEAVGAQQGERLLLLRI